MALTCPDGGTCHHDCKARCFRVQACGPLSGVFPEDRWPAEVAALHEHPDTQIRTLEEARDAVQACLDVLDKASKLLFNTAMTIRAHAPKEVSGA